MKKENKVQEKKLEQVVGGENSGAIYNNGGAIYNDGTTDGAFGLGKSGALAPNEVPNGGTDQAGIGGGGKK